MIELKLITEEDLEWARKLRNDNKEAFFSPSEVTPEEHEIWFHDLQYKRDKFFYIIFSFGQRIGTISATVISDMVLEVGNVILDKEYRGKGILKEVLDDPIFATKQLMLEVRPENEGAIKAYKKVGFEPVKVVMFKK